MTSRQFVSLAVATAILAAALPASAETGSTEARLRASIDRALRAPAPPMAAPETGAKASKGTRHSQSGGTSNGGGGGGHMFMMLLGTAITVGATYFIVKEMQKDTAPTPAPTFR